jgi:hypothetical protein
VQTTAKDRCRCRTAPSHAGLATPRCAGISRRAGHLLTGRQRNQTRGPASHQPSRRRCAHSAHRPSGAAGRHHDRQPRAGHVRPAETAESTAPWPYELRFYDPPPSGVKVALRLAEPAAPAVLVSDYTVGLAAVQGSGRHRPAPAHSSDLVVVGRVHQPAAIGR